LCPHGESQSEFTGRFWATQEKAAEKNGGEKSGLTLLFETSSSEKEGGRLVGSFGGGVEKKKGFTTSSR